MRNMDLILVSLLKLSKFIPIQNVGFYLRRDDAQGTKKFALTK